MSALYRFFFWSGTPAAVDTGPYVTWGGGSTKRRKGGWHVVQRDGSKVHYDDAKEAWLAWTALQAEPDAPAPRTRAARLRAAPRIEVEGQPVTRAVVRLAETLARGVTVEPIDLMPRLLAIEGEALRRAEDDEIAAALLLLH